MASAGCVAALLCMPAAVQAQAAQAPPDAAQRMHFDLPSQPLEKALSAFGGLTDHSILVDSAVTQGLTARAVAGDFTPQEGLRQLLRGTGLSAKYSGGKAFTLVPGTAPGDARPDDAVAADALAAQGAHGLPTLGGVPAAASAEFAGALQTAITSTLCAAQPGAFGRYRAALQLWIGAEGRVGRAHLLESSGLAARDAELLALLRKLSIGRAPPPGLPQPVTLLLSPRTDPARTCRAALGLGE